MLQDDSYDLDKCRAMVKNRPCQRTAMNNGYCSSHQYLAVQDILEKLDRLKAEAQRLAAMKEDVPVNASKLKLLTQQIDMLKEEMAGAKRICSEDADCSMHLKDMLASVKDVLESTPYQVSLSDTSHPLNRMKLLEKQVSDTASGGLSFQDAQAFTLSKEYELARRRQKETTNEVDQLRYRLQEAGASGEGQERKFQASLAGLTSDLQQAIMKKQQADQIVVSLQNRLDKCQGDAKQVSAVYTDTIERQKQELETFKAKYSDMVGRELRLGKSVEMLTANERELQKAIEELKMSYEKKMLELRNQYAEQTSITGSPILSKREEELQVQVEQLKQDLQVALEDLKMATEMGKEAVYQMNSADKPYAQIARELVDVNAMLQRKNQELAQLQAIHDRKSSEYAQAELKVAQRIDQATAKDRSEIHKLSNDLVSSERKLAALQQEVVNLQTTSFELKRKHQNEVQTLNARIRETENHLMQVRSQRDAERNAIERQKQILATEKESMKADMDFKFNQMRDSLNQNYAEKVRLMQAANEATQLQLNQERRNLVIAQRQAQDVAAQIERNRQELERYRSAYDKKMADFYAQKQALATTLSQAQAQANQYAQMESDYKKRVDILRQNADVQRQRYESQINQLNDQLKKAVMNRNTIANSLEKCSAARDSIVQKVTLLTDENMRLKDMFLQQKARNDLMRTQYEAHLEKLRAQATTMQTDLRNCAQRLQDATLVHDHVKQMKEEAQSLRANLEEQIRAAKGNEQALRRLLHDRELEKQQVNRLQAALSECSLQRQQSEAGLTSTNGELRDMKRMQTQLTDEIKSISDEYQRAIQQREAAIARQQLQQEVKEDEMRREVQIARAKSIESADQVKRLQKQRQMLSESLANTEYERARQVQALVDAQNITQPSVHAGPGKSSLLQI